MSDRPTRSASRQELTGGTQLLLLEPSDSAYRRRIEHAASEAGLSVHYVDSLEGIGSDAALVGVGPSVGAPLQLARHLRRIGGQALLVFFCASTSERDALYAELIRDPFIYPRYELIEIADNPRQLAMRMGNVVSRVERQSHAASGTRRHRTRSRGATSYARPTQAAEKYMASVVAHANEAIFSTDEAGNVLTWNAAAERTFGFATEAALGQPIEFLNSPEASLRQLGGVARRVLASGEPEQAHVTCQSSSGGPVRVAVSASPVMDARGGVLGVSVVAHDDSELLRIQAALREANRQKDEFLAIMSHELRTPLTSILGYTDMLLRGLSGPLAPLTNKYIGNVRTAGDRLLELVNGLLDYTRLEAGVERLELRPVDLPRVVGQTVQQFNGQARSKEIDLRTEVSKGVAARVEADEDKLAHVLRSMLGNALKFTPRGGWVSVHVGPDPDSQGATRVSISDSGIGLRDEQLPRVWERFYQGDASLTRPYGGMGLGLSIARHLVTLHGGTVGAESRGPELGSTFWFSLPHRRASS